MNKLLTSIVLVFHLSSILAQDISGTWYGNLKKFNLRIVFHIEMKDSTYSATMDSPDQGATGIPVKKVTFKNSVLDIDMPKLGAKYKGNYIKEKELFDGVFSQSGAEFKLELSKNKIEKQEIVRPQNPIKPYPYKEKEVVFKNKADKIKLAGTLTIPKQKKKSPAVVLITGSGPQDRNQEIANHKPFLVLADFLTRNGIAVLRFDDRGTAKSTGNHSTATSEDFANDVVSAVEYLKTRKEIDITKIGLIGHSEGGLIAPLAAQKSKDISYIIMLAGPGLPGDQIVYLQNKLIGKASKQDEIGISQTNELYKIVFDILKNEKELDKAKQTALKAIQTKLAYFKDSLKSKELIPKDQVTDFVEELITPWFKYFIEYEPVKTLEKTTCPVLSLIGNKDLQVPAKENQEVIEKALLKANNHNFSIKTLDNLNHLFQECKTGSPMEYEQIEQTISPKALQAMLDWIKKQVK